MTDKPEALETPGTLDAPADDDGWLRLAPAAVWTWRLAGLARACVVAAGGGFAIWLWSRPSGEPATDALAALAAVKGAAWSAALAAALLLGLGAALAFAVARARYRAWGYRLRDDALVLRHGVLWRTTSVVPLARIQHVDTRRGPLDRWLGLARVVVYTAGVTGGALELPGLARADAAALRDRLAALTGTDDAV